MQVHVDVHVYVDVLRVVGRLTSRKETIVVIGLITVRRLLGLLKCRRIAMRKHNGKLGLL